ncbi:hypothetical protein DFH11DRAFT_1585314 [Phellopilus nigrolimitatus]|nr:hypothetical protein DFH11DRAFT_1585314 [Phellopilus nigrolimitatus]
MAAMPVQVLPRRVAQVAQSVRNVALSGAAMTVLLASSDVLCFEGGRSFKIKLVHTSFLLSVHGLIAICVLFITS